MNHLIAQIQQVAKEHQALPSTINLNRYRKPEDMNCGDEVGDETTFIKANQTLLEAVEFLKENHPKVTINIITFDPVAYHQWRGDHADTRDLRAQWINEQAHFSEE